MMDEGQPRIHITSHNQQEGITAHTVNVYGSVPAKATLSQFEHEALSDGHRYRATLNLEAPYALPVLCVSMRGKTVQSLSLVGIDLSNGGMMNHMEGSYADDSGTLWFSQLSNASGHYRVEVLTREPEPILLDVSQEPITS